MNKKIVVLPCLPGSVPDDTRESGFVVFGDIVEVESASFECRLHVANRVNRLLVLKSGIPVYFKNHVSGYSNCAVP